MQYSFPHTKGTKIFGEMEKYQRKIEDNTGISVAFYTAIHTLKLLHLAFYPLVYPMKKEFNQMVKAIEVTKRYTPPEVKKLAQLFLYLNDIE